MNPLKLIPPPYNWLAGLVAVLLVAVIIMTMGAKIGAFISDPFGWKASAAAHDKAGNVIGQAGKTASDASMKATGEQARRELGQQATEQEHRDEILKAPNARDGAGAAGDVGLAGLCQRASYRDHPRCAGLRRPDTSPAPR